MMEAIYSSETSVSFHRTVRCYVSRESPYRSQNCEHLKSKIMDPVREDNVTSNIVWGTEQNHEGYQSGEPVSGPN
jgi:hypothetical protein